MSISDSEPDFHYDGQLVFNGLYQTEVLNASFDFEDIIENELKDFERGSADRPSSGYESLNFGKIAGKSRFVSPQLKELVSDVKGIRHRYENWEQRELPDGQTQDTRLIHSYDVYWDFPGYVAVKGDKTQARRASDIVEFKLGNYIKSREIEFDPDFLLWVFYRAMNEEPLSEHLDVRYLSDANIEGEEDRYGKEVSVDRSTNVTKSTNILSGILRDKQLIGLEGTFEARGNFVKANIQVGGRVHIKVAHAIQEANDLERISISIVFLSELLDAFTDWEELEGGEKYPPDEFFQDVADECKKQGDEPTFAWGEVVEKYRDKRTGNVAGDNNIQVGLRDFE